MYMRPADLDFGRNVDVNPEIASFSASSKITALLSSRHISNLSINFEKVKKTGVTEFQHRTIFNQPFCSDSFLKRGYIITVCHWQ